MKLKIDPALCEASGRCYKLYPDFFAKGAGGKAEAVMTGELQGDAQIVDATAAANACPNAAIKVE